LSINKLAKPKKRRMKIEIYLPDEEYKKLKEIYKIFDKDINESIEHLTINLIKDSLTEIKSLI